jgi:predicted transcriptional regulator
MKEETVLRIENAVIEAYLASGQGMTIPEIAKASGWGETTARKAVRGSEQLELSEKMARITRQDGALHQYRAVDAYIPTRRWLREEVVRLRQQKDSWIPQRSYLR